LPYDPARMQDIADFLQISMTQLIKKYYGKLSDDGKFIELDDDLRSPCPFFSMDNNRSSCDIYSVRPDGCRLFPFETDFGTAGVDCPGAKKAWRKFGK